MAKMNAINNASSQLTIDPGASGDSYVQFSINTTGEFILGVDDSASDAFKISQGSALGTNDTFIMTSAGERTMPLQPAFLALNEPVSNVTGDGTVYTVTSNSERFDQGSDYSSPTFTAPISGLYLLNGLCWYTNVGSSHTSSSPSIVTSNRSYAGFLNPYIFRQTGSSQYNGDGIYVLGDMDAADTASLTVYVSGGTKTVGIGYWDGATTRGMFNGALAV